MRADQAERLKDLEKENTQLEKHGVRLRAAHGEPRELARGAAVAVLHGAQARRQHAHEIEGDLGHLDDELLQAGAVEGQQPRGIPRHDGGASRLLVENRHLPEVVGGFEHAGVLLGLGSVVQINIHRALEQQVELAAEISLTQDDLARQIG